MDPPPPLKPKLLQRPKPANTPPAPVPATTTASADENNGSSVNATNSASNSTPTSILVGPGPVQLLKRQGGDSTATASSDTITTPRSTQASPVPGTPAAAEKDGGSNKPISGILERPKATLLGTGVGANLSGLNALDCLRPYTSPTEHATTLIDSNLRMLTDSVSFRHLLEENKSTRDFFVVCAIGPPGSGKSTVLSYLANPKQTKFFSPNKNDLIFPPRPNSENQESTYYVSSNRTIFIELAPVFSSSTAVNFVGLVQQYGTIEAATVTWNLRLMRWALSVSHLVLLCSDGTVDPNLIQLVNTAEMIQPVESAFGESVYPEIVLVCNKVPISSFYSWTEPGYSKAQTKWNNLYRSLTGKTPRITPNVIILPHDKSNFGFEEHRFQTLRRTLDQWDRYNRAPYIPDVEGKPKIPQTVTIPEWSQIASKYWEEMQHQSFFSSYLQSYLKFFP